MFTAFAAGPYSPVRGQPRTASGSHRTRGHSTRRANLASPKLNALPKEDYLVWWERELTVEPANADDSWQSEIDIL